MTQPDGPPYEFDTSDSDTGRAFRATLMGACVVEVGQILMDNVQPMPGFMLLVFQAERGDERTDETSLASNVPPERILQILEWQTNRVKLMMADAQGKPS